MIKQHYKFWRLEPKLQLQTLKVIFQFSCSFMSYSLEPHGLQHTRFPCSSPAPRICSNSCPLSRWCHPTISSSVIPFFSCPKSFPASVSFPMSQFFASSGHSMSFSFSISPSNEYSGLISFRMDWLDLLAVQGTLKSFYRQEYWDFTGKNTGVGCQTHSGSSWPRDRTQVSCIAGRFFTVWATGVCKGIQAGKVITCSGHQLQSSVLQKHPGSHP